MNTLQRMRIATWNVSAVRRRLPLLLPWLDERRPDVVCLQETKLADGALLDLLGDELTNRSYEIAMHGEASWNGVAIFSRVGLEDVVPGLAGAPGFPQREALALSATCGGIRVHSIYADEDVFDPEAYVGQTHVTPPERAALRELQALGLRDVVRDRWPGERVFTYWDFRAGKIGR